ncbi:MAG TPA: sugar ABC transporter ATP-binding protein [Flexilinea sp.]|jgi:ABC-type sugar transport system ATPase subunit|nr:sugar ABC transporter ATP-binding protein [Flexilinea sp.]HPR70531.1 sugar ABC transporter ATP-binding protein [Flexilinea sp.]HQG88791.1 sugar ABC transporter ATP-binding protein [Flexilinea sp.]
MPLLQMVNITKIFPGVKALSNVNFSLEKGEVKALVGENGAGKSTLIKILSGIYQPTEGEIYIEGDQVIINNPATAQRLGIASVHQEINLEPYLSVAENIFLKKQPKNRFGLIDYVDLFTDASYWLNQLGVEIDPRKPLGMISIAEKQMVAIAQAISMDSKIIVFDEPTSSLTQKETDQLFNVIDKLKEKNIGIIYISHRLEEIFHICTSLTVMRDGEVTGNKRIDEINSEEIIRLMVGREMKDMFHRTKTYAKEPVLEIKGLTVKGILNDINLTLHKGEILGLAGLVGAGRTELARAIFGDLPFQNGEILMNGKSIKPKHPSDSINMGIVLIPEDRKELGLILQQSVEENITITILHTLQKVGFINKQKQKEKAEILCKELAIKTPSIQQKVKYLSGGNQQRVVIGKWLATIPKVLIIDEPTRGIDVAAKSEIHKILDSLASEGMAILMISSELPEIISMSDRVAIMYQGRINSLLEKKDLSEEIIVTFETGQKIEINHKEVKNGK